MNPQRAQAEYSEAIEASLVPQISDSECIDRLAQAVEAPSEANLALVAQLIGRLAVVIE